MKCYIAGNRFSKFIPILISGEYIKNKTIYQLITNCPDLTVYNNQEVAKDRLVLPLHWHKRILEPTKYVLKKKVLLL